MIKVENAICLFFMLLPACSGTGFKIPPNSVPVIPAIVRGNQEFEAVYAQVEAIHPIPVTVNASGSLDPTLGAAVTFRVLGKTEGNLAFRKLEYERALEFKHFTIIVRSISQAFNGCKPQAIVGENVHVWIYEDGGRLGCIGISSTWNSGVNEF